MQVKRQVAAERGPHHRPFGLKIFSSERAVVHHIVQVMCAGHLRGWSGPARGRCVAGSSSGPGRSQVLDLVREAIPAGVPVVLVSHSLGTVVARDLLNDATLRDRVMLWVTAGSPLGLDAVQKNLLTPGARNPGVSWVSAYDVHDIVALGHPLLPSWGPPLVDVKVDNGDSPHSIERYLSHPEVAGPIGTAVRANRSAPS